MGLIERPQVSDEAFGFVSGDDLPAFGRPIGTGEIKGIGCALAGDALLFVEETIGGHVGIALEAAGAVEMLVMPDGGVGWRSLRG